MKTGHHDTGAKIYAFPANRIVRSKGMRELEMIEMEAQEHRVDIDSWYHQEAIEEAPGGFSRKQ